MGIMEIFESMFETMGNLMYIIAFFLGVLVILAAIFAFSGNKNDGGGNVYIVDGRRVDPEREERERREKEEEKKKENV